MTTMKRTVLGVLAVVMMAVGGGCATTLKGVSSVNNAVLLEGARKDIQVWVDDKPVEYRMIVASRTGNIETLKAAIDLNPRKKASYKITIRQGGQEATFTVTRSVGMGWFWLDLIFTGGVGLLVDWGTGYWYEFGNKDILVEAMMRKYGKPIAPSDPAAAAGTP